MIRPLLLAASLSLVAGFTGARAADHVISQRSRQFSQSALTVRPGAAVTFRNDDEVIHNVFSNTPGFEFNLRSQRPGTAAAVPFRQRGTAQVRCAFHPQMRLVVTVR